jgi:hypothetical protein
MGEEKAGGEPMKEPGGGNQSMQEGRGGQGDAVEVETAQRSVRPSRIPATMSTPATTSAAIGRRPTR